MQRYIATVVPGLEQLVALWLGGVRGVVVTSIFDGLIEFESELSWKRFQNIRYLTNCFIVLSAGQVKQPSVKALNELLSQKLNVSSVLREVVRGKRTFRVVSSIANKTIAPNRDAVKMLEGRIERNLRLTLNVKAPSVEFWMMVREDGRHFFVVRISALRKENKIREAGELRSEIAHCMVRLSRPRVQDVVFDPFCGRGTLLAERGYYMPYVHLFGADMDPQLAREAQKKLAHLKNSTIHSGDFSSAGISDKSVTHIITDPPWGDFESHQNILSLYRDMLKEFSRLLTQQGTVTILSGAKDELKVAVKEEGFEIRNVYNILVSGKKAGLYMLKRAKL